MRPILDLRRLNFSLYKGKFKMLTIKAIMSPVQEGDWFVTIDLKDAYFPGRSKTQEVPSVCLWREGLPIQGPALRPGFSAENVYETLPLTLTQHAMHCTLTPFNWTTRTHCTNHNLSAITGHHTMHIHDTAYA